MAPKNRIIIDTDPGVDDVLAILLALSASPEDLEVVMLSVTYGNVPLQGCLRNVVALFHVLEKEMAWRESTGRTSKAFGGLKAFKPIVAIGAEHALEDEELMADHFHGADGLHGVHEAHPDLTPSETWRSLFADGDAPAASDALSFSSYFTPSKTPSHKEILRILKEEPADTITIIAIGPLTNMALAAAEDPETFLRVKELVVMGGAVHVEGNITPVAEFNCYADAVAAARVYALTSPTPASTMPPTLHGASKLPPYPATLSRTLSLTLLPLDITTPHLLNKNFFLGQIASAEQAGSPLARWCRTFMVGTFNKIESILGDGSEPGLSLHDPLCVWYMMLRDDPRWTATAKPEDLRVETSGQWTRGMHVVDRRQRSKPGDHTEGFASVAANAIVQSDGSAGTPAAAAPSAAAAGDDNVPGDTMGWLSVRKGNRINRIVGSPGELAFADVLMKSLFA
ncbi:inosine-uridine preferring nucleoside hydrolase [Sporothrix brasiliensis 5110]|uniref:Inosine-uridine preferring nucleoside hydrolase n=1 Tax=Sporothrix brasiliensis 5110 TaxID=1398154 RepID=A0A0C2FVM9_9PEZI|nr:inosine-uridine preferring nucleoside hydrolase [Sporothrix brasiliensis 5110]KIH95073.1 inosine-uridine preferring nucleoside hydrolase [Sporothrix brasiliensis 5110]